MKKYSLMNAGTNEGSSVNNAVIDLRIENQEKGLNQGEDKNEKGRFYNHLLRIFGDIALINITNTKMNQYIPDRIKEGVSPKTVNKERMLLRQIFQMAEGYELVPEDYNPALAAKSPEKKAPVEDKRKKTRVGMAISPEKIPVLISHLGETRYLSEFLALSGLRRGLVLTLKWSQIRDGYVHFEEWDQKWKKSIPKC